MAIMPKIPIKISKLISLLNFLPVSVTTPSWFNDTPATCNPINKSGMDITSTQLLLYKAKNISPKNRIFPMNPSAPHTHRFMQEYVPQSVHIAGDAPVALKPSQKEIVCWLQFGQVNFISYHK